MAMSRSAEARWRAHAAEGRVATGLRSRASSLRQFFHGVVGLVCWVVFAAIWLYLFAFNLPETWPLILIGIVALFFMLLVMNFIWVRWNKRIYWRHDGRRQQAVQQETRFDTDVLGREVIAPERDLLRRQPKVTIGVDDNDSKIYGGDGGVLAPSTSTAPLTPVGAAVGGPVVPVVPALALAPLPVAGAVRVDLTPPSTPVVVGGSADWRTLGRVELRASGSVDTGSGLAGYEWRSSLDGGTSWSEANPGSVVAVEREGETLVAFRAFDHAGNRSGWTQGEAGMVRQRRLSAPAPQIVGVPSGWSAAEQILVVSELCSLGAGFTTEYRVSSGGAEWSAPAAGSQVAVQAEGITRVAFRSVGAGLASDWVEATVMLDRGAPSAPQISGGSGEAWSGEGGALVRAFGGTDALSGIAGYEYRFSLDGGASWSAPAPGAEVRVVAEGLTIVQFRALDGAGNPSPWSPEVTQ